MKFTPPRKLVFSALFLAFAAVANTAQAVMCCPGFQYNDLPVDHTCLSTVDDSIDFSDTIYYQCKGPIMNANTSCSNQQGELGRIGNNLVCKLPFDKKAFDAKQKTGKVKLESGVQNNTKLRTSPPPKDIFYPTPEEEKSYKPVKLNLKKLGDKGVGVKKLPPPDPMPTDPTQMDSKE